MKEIKFTWQPASEWLGDLMYKINSGDFTKPHKVNIEEGKYVWNVPICSHPDIASDGGKINVNPTKEDWLKLIKNGTTE